MPKGDWEGVYELWLREKTLSCTPQTVLRAKRVMTLYVRWRRAKKLPCLQISDLACRQDIVRWRDYRLDHEAGRKTIAADLATLSSLFQ